MLVLCPCFSSSVIHILCPASHVSYSLFSLFCLSSSSVSSHVLVPHLLSPFPSSCGSFSRLPLSTIPGPPFHNLHYSSFFILLLAHGVSHILILVFFVHSAKPLQTSLMSAISKPSVSVGLGIVYRLDPVRVEMNFGVPLVATRGEGARKGFQLGLGVEFL